MHSRLGAILSKPMEVSTHRDAITLGGSSKILFIAEVMGKEWPAGREGIDTRLMLKNKLEVWKWKMCRVTVSYLSCSIAKR